MAVTDSLQADQARGGDRQQAAQPLAVRLLQAVKRGDVAAASAILSADDADLRRLGEVAFEGGVWTPLGFACRLGQLDLVRLLLSKGADVEQECKGLISNDASRKDGCSFGSVFRPVHLAALGRHSRVLKALIEAGANSSAMDEYGDTPLYIASRQLSPECVQVLLEQSCVRSSVDLPNAEDETPMMSALMALHAAQQASSSGGGGGGGGGRSSAQQRALRELRSTTASACLIIARLLEAGANANDSSAVDPVKGHPVPYSSALLAALEYGMDDLAVLLHLHGARMPPGSSGSLAAARPDSV